MLAVYQQSRRNTIFSYQKQSDPDANEIASIIGAQNGASMKTRRKLIIALGTGAFAVPLISLAQQLGDPPRIGLLWLEGGNSAGHAAAFRDGLRAHGYVEGKNIRIVDHFLVDRYELLPEAAGNVVRQKVDVIICYGATALQAAGKATSTIPIIMVLSGDPVKLGVAASLSKPGGNVTGTSSISQELSGKRLELLKQVAPGINHLAVLLYAESAAEVRALRNYEAAARALNLEVHPVEIHTPGDIGSVIAGIAQMKVQAIAVVASTLLTANSQQVVAAVEKIRLPAIYPNTDFPHLGGLMAYGSNLSEGFRRVATYVDKILRGAKPGDLPIEQPTQVALVINMNAAKMLGLTMPRSLLLRADELIQ
jgi:putative ABC transport system substrate-binding protein